MTASLRHFLRRAKSPLRATLLVAAITLVVGSPGRRPESIPMA